MPTRPAEINDNRKDDMDAKIAVKMQMASGKQATLTLDEAGQVSIALPVAFSHEVHISVLRNAVDELEQVDKRLHEEG